MPLRPSRNPLPWTSRLLEVEAEAVGMPVRLVVALHKDTRGDMDCMCNCWWWHSYEESRMM